jgi:hypothetical protein
MKRGFEVRSSEPLCFGPRGSVSLELEPNGPRKRVAGLQFR